MHLQSQEDILESMLKSAVIENSLEELEDYPPDSELDQIQIPKELDKHMYRIIKRHTFKEKAKKVLQSIRKGVSAAMIILGISFAFLLCSQDIRAACLDVIVRIYEKYIEFDASGTEVSGTVRLLEFDYIPDGYRLDITDYNGFMTRYKYTNDVGDEICLYFGEKFDIFQMDNENYDIVDTTIGNSNGKIFISKNKTFPNTILWNNELGYFKLTSTLDYEVMKKIAENIN